MAVNFRVDGTAENSFENDSLTELKDSVVYNNFEYTSVNIEGASIFTSIL